MTLQWTKLCYEMIPKLKKQEGSLLALETDIVLLVRHYRDQKRRQEMKLIQVRAFIRIQLFELKLLLRRLSCSSLCLPNTPTFLIPVRFSGIG